MEKKSFKSSLQSPDTGYLYESFDTFPLNFDVLETQERSFCVAVCHLDCLKLFYFSKLSRTRPAKSVEFYLSNTKQPEYRDSLLSVRFDDVGTEPRYVGCAGDAGNIYLVPLVSDTQKDFITLSEHMNVVMDFRFLSAGRLASASQDNSVILWDITGKTVLWRWIDVASRLSAANCLVVSQDESFILAGYDDSSLRTLDIRPEGDESFDPETLSPLRVRGNFGGQLDGLLDSNVVALDKFGSIFFALSLTGVLICFTVPNFTIPLVQVVKVINTCRSEFRYFDQLNVCESGKLTLGFGDNDWAALELETSLEPVLKHKEKERISKVFLLDRVGVAVVAAKTRVWITCP